jgi:hypothetical protein
MSCAEEGSTVTLRFSDNVPTDAVAAAAALLAEDPQPPAAQPPAPVAEQPARVQEQPEQPPVRDERGRFVPRQQPTEQATPQQAAPTEPAAPAEPEQDYKALWEAERQERARLQGTYYNNAEQQRLALQEAQREAREAREQAVQAAAQERTRVLTEFRQAVSALPENHPQYVSANRDLLQMERQYLEAERADFDTRRQEAEAQTQQQTAAQVEVAAKSGAWGTVQFFGNQYGEQLGLAPDDVQEVIAQFQTPELATIIRELPAEKVVNHIRYTLGPAFQRALEARVQIRAEVNRQQAVAQGTHQQHGTPPPQPAEPEFNKYTWRNDRQRLGIEAAASFVASGGIDR